MILRCGAHNRAALIEQQRACTACADIDSEEGYGSSPPFGPTLAYTRNVAAGDIRPKLAIQKEILRPEIVRRT